MDKSLRTGIGSGLGLLLGLVYDTFEEEWYGATIADGARASHRVRLFLKTLLTDGGVGICRAEASGSRRGGSRQRGTRELLRLVRAPLAMKTV